MPSPARLAALALLALLPIASLAQEAAASSREEPATPPVEDGSWSAAARLGAALPLHRDVKGFDPGFTFEGSMSYRATRHLALELGFGRFSLSSREDGSGSSCSSALRSCGGASGPAVGAWSLLAAVKAILPFEIGQLYAVGGAGSYFFESVAPGAFLGGGALLRVVPGLHLGVEAKYLAVAPTLEHRTLRVDSLQVMAGVWASM